MIDESRTLEIYGYTSDSLSRRSEKRVIAVCEDCGKYREIGFGQYRDLCVSCAHKGRHHSEETRKKISEANKGRNPSADARERMRIGHTGRKHSEETKRKMSASANCKCGKDAPAYGRRHTEDTKKKMSKVKKGRVVSEETKRKISNTLKGNIISEETRKKISESNKRVWTKEKKAQVSKLHTGRKVSDETRKKISEARLGKHRSNETRERTSATKQGISYDEWESYACESPYCPRFNEACKEANREKYGRRCFICGLPESENITSTRKQKKLAVHHVDMNKNQGCDGIKWKLVPVCLKHHNHSELWTARITYLLENVW